MTRVAIWDTFKYKYVVFQVLEYSHYEDNADPRWYYRCHETAMPGKTVFILRQSSDFVMLVVETFSKLDIVFWFNTSISNQNDRLFKSTFEMHFVIENMM